MQIKMRKVLALLSCLAMLCTLLPMGVFTATVTAATNLVVNGDFEGGNTTGWSGGLSASADAAHDGSYGATATATGSWGSLLKQTVSLNANSAYYMSFWFKSNADAVTNASFEIKYKGNSGSETKIKLLNKNSTSVSLKTSVTEWTQVVVHFTTGDDNYATTNLLFYRGASGAGDAASICIDSIELYEINYVENAGFETGDFTGYKNEYSGEIVTDVVHSGNYAHKTTNTAKKYQGQASTIVMDVEPNTDYTASVWYYYEGDNATGSAASFYLYIHNQDGENVSSVTNYPSAAGTWTQAFKAFNSGENTQIKLVCSNRMADDGGTYYFDDFALIGPAPVDSGDEPVEPDEPEVPATPDEVNASNLVVNGYFNDGNANGWTVEGGAIEAYNGDYMLKGTTTGRYGSVAKQTIAVEANTDYTLDVDALYVGGAASAQARVHVYAADGSTDLVSGYYWNINPNELSEHQLSFNTGDNTQITIGVQQRASASSSDAFDGNIYYDEFELLKVVPAKDPSFDGYIYNGDFETGDLTNWTVVDGGEIASEDGNYILKGTATAKYDYHVKQTVAVEANTNYIITFKAKLAADGGQVRFVVVPTGSDSKLNGDAYYFTSSTEWQTYQIQFNSGDNTSIDLCPTQGVTNGGAIYYDDITMEKIEADAGYQGLYPETMTTGADIRFMTYNVLCGQDEANGGYSWGSDITGRPEKAFAMINYYKPDVIAFEEFSGEWYDAFVAQMTDYELCYMQSADTSKNNGKLYTCLAYNKNTIRLLDTDLFRNTVSRWGTQGMRYVNVGFFEVIATGEKFIGAATHPDAGALVGDQDLNDDGVAEEGDGYWRQFQLEEAAAYVKGLSDEYQMPVVWGGDFNSGLDGTYDDYTSWYKVADAGFTDATNGRYIDHIFYNGMATHLYETTVADSAVNGASDHKAVFADIQFLDEFATPIKTAKDYIKTQGRTTLKDGAMWLDFSASGIEFSANCEGTVALNLNVKSIKNTDATYGGIYFTVIVDGVTKERAECRITETGSVQLVLAEDLPAGNHTFEVYRQTEHRGAEVGISSIVMSGSFNEKPADNRLYIEFIGDSISTGYGALGDNNVDSSYADNPLYQDATVAYPYLTAKALDADFSDVCYSGLGCKYGYSSVTMQTVYTAQRYQYDQTTQYNFSTRQPDVVVIALGTNDIANQTDAALREAGYQEMLDLVRAKNPNAKIVWIAGMMKTDDNAMIEALIESNGGAAEGLYYLGLTTNTAGAGWHPSAAGQQVFADELVAFLNSDVLVRYVGDEMTDEDDIMSYGGSSRMEMTADELGLAFKFTIAVQGMAVTNKTEAVYDNATINAFGGEYKLLRMGAVLANAAAFGTELTLEDVETSDYCVDINAKYLCNLLEDSASYAVRITNIPVALEDRIIYARAYYVFEYEGREVIVYDDLQQANYSNKYDSNDGVLEW